MARLLALLGWTALAVLGIAALLWASFRPPEPTRVRASDATFADVTVIEPGRGRATGRTVVLRGDRIAGIHATSAGDGSERPHAGRFVLPGLIDMHVHQPTTIGGLDAYFGLLYLAHGVTTIRNTADFEGTSLQMRADTLAGAYPGPRVFSCGRMLDGDEPLWPQAMIVRTAEQAVAAVEQLAAEGVDCIKIYSRLEADALAAVREAARAADLRVVGHVPRGLAFEEARLDDAQHLIGVPPIEVRPPRDQTGLEPASEVHPMIAGWAELDAARIGAVARASLDDDIAHTPTLVYLQTLSVWDRYDELRQMPAATLLPRLFPDVFWRPPQRFRLGGTVTPETWPAFRRSFEQSLLVVRTLQRAGVRLHAGTDTGNPFVVPGASLHEELRLLVRAGLTPEEAFTAATTAPGEFLPETALGRLRAGAPADLLIFREDPTRDLEALATLEAVVARGRYYPKELLDRDVERYRAHYHGFVWDKLLLSLAAALRD